MTISTPPRPPSPARTAPDGKPLEREEIEALVQALIEDARRETRRRRRRYWAVAALLASAGVVAFILLQGDAGSQSASPAASARSSLLAGATTAKIAFISEPPGRGYCGTVYVMNADGSGQRRLASGGFISPGCAQEGGPAWSPDGRKIAFVREGLLVVNADGSGQRRLSRRASFAPSWSPDGRNIAFVRKGLLVVNADGSGERKLTNAAAGIEFVRIEFPPTWSPDGRSIAFVGNVGHRPGLQDMEIHVVSADGSTLRRLTRNTWSDSDPVWSPDGRRIAFESNGQLWVMNADGSGQRKLTRRGAHNFNPAWSPDGKRIAFERGRRGSDCSYCPGSWRQAVYVMNADGSGQQRLTQGASQPYWSPDGRKIAFVSQRAGHGDIYVMNPDGSGQRNLTRTAGNRESQPVWSPAQTR